jgi:ATP-dependent DNA helicase RecG
VLSYPGPDRSIRIEQLRAGNVAPRRYRNRLIGEDHSYFQVRLPVQSATRIAGTATDGRHVPEQVTEQVMQIVKALGTHEFRSREFMELLGLKHSPTFLYDYLQPSINAGFVHMTLPDKPRNSKQRYRVTDSGRKLLTQQEDNDDHNGDI